MSSEDDDECELSLDETITEIKEWMESEESMFPAEVANSAFFWLKHLKEAMDGLDDDSDEED